MSRLNLKEAQVSGLRQSQVQTELLALCLKTEKNLSLPSPGSGVASRACWGSTSLTFVMLFFHVSIFFLLVGIAVIKLGLLNLTGLTLT